MFRYRWERGRFLEPHGTVQVDVGKVQMSLLDCIAKLYILRLQVLFADWCVKASKISWQRQGKVVPRARALL